jgi:ribosomal protein S18 acetylase RimI-like enzyme
MKLSNKDIILQKNEAFYYFQFLPWDTEFFGLPSYSLDIEKSNMLINPSIVSQIKNRLCGAFVTAKIDTSLDYSIVLLFSESDFQYIDTEVTLEHLGSPCPAMTRENILITELKGNQRLPYEKLGSVYSLTRFHTDPHITLVKANQLWIDYLKNFVADDQHHMIVAVIENDIIGTILVDTADSEVRLLYVSVSEAHQNQGIGSLLIQDVVQRFKGKRITVGTQIKNTKAINFYIQNGFSKIRNAKTILHRW